MHVLAEIVERNTELFSGVHQHRPNGLRTVRPLYPNRIKFICSPNRYQFLYPGLYFEIPERLSLYEMELLESAVLKVLRTKAHKATTTPLQIPETLGRKLSASTSSFLFNGFVTRKHKTYLKSAKCVWIDPTPGLYSTSILEPEYGEVFSIEDTGSILSSLITMLTLCCGPVRDSRGDVAKRNISLVRAAYPEAHTPDLNIGKLGELSLSFGSITLQDFESPLGVNVVQAMLYSFLDLQTDLSNYMRWR
tara:strand:- start:109797 stop:110543 length:747 start_codon:yes stop_codon:yes gene_type:complete